MEWIAISACCKSLRELFERVQVITAGFFGRRYRLQDLDIGGAVEARLDHLENFSPQDDMDTIVEKVLAYPGYLSIITYRSRNGNGDYEDGKREIAIATIRAAIAHTKFDGLVDIEHALVEQGYFPDIKELCDIMEEKGGGIILSFHNFDTEAEELDADGLFAKMLAVDPRIIPKIAVMRGSILRLEGYRIFLVMGDNNDSRFAQPFLTFARLNEEDSGSASGQPTLNTMLSYMEGKIQI